MNTMERFDNFLKIFDFYHVECCEHVDCSNCLLAINLRYLYVQTTVQQNDLLLPYKILERLKFTNSIVVDFLGLLEQQRVF